MDNNMVKAAAEKYKKYWQLEILMKNKYKLCKSILDQFQLVHLEHYVNILTPIWLKHLPDVALTQFRRKFCSEQHIS
jgi:hypothetical protein